MVRKLIPTIVGLVLASAGCSDDTSSTDAGIGTDGQVGTDGAGEPVISGVVRDQETDDRLADVTIAVLDADPPRTTQSGTDGSFSLPATVGESIFLVAEAAGFLSFVRGTQVPEGGETSFDLQMRAPADEEQLHTDLSLPARDPADGAVLFAFEAPSQLGGETATVNLTNDGAYAFDAAFAAIRSAALLPGTHQRNTILTIVNVSPGDASVTGIAAPAGTTCRETTPSLQPYPVLANTRTQIDVVCETE